jgi:hypothetical protein
MMKRMKRSWIVDALSAVAYALVDGLQLLPKVENGRAVADRGDERFGSCLRVEYYWGPKSLFLLRMALWIRRGGGGRESDILGMVLGTSLTTVGV